MAADGVLSVLHVALERAAHFVDIRKVYGLHLVQRDVIVTENQSLLPPGYIVEHSRAGHRPSRGQPAEPADRAEKIALSGALGGKLYHVQPLLHERKQTGYHGELLLRRFVPVGIVVYRAENYVNPLVKAELLPGVSELVKVNDVGAEILESRKLYLPGALFRFRELVAKLDYPPVLLGFEKSVAAILPHLPGNDRIPERQPEIRQRERQRLRFNVDVHAYLREESHLLLVAYDAVHDGLPVLFLRNELPDEFGGALRVYVSVVVLEALEHPVPHERRQLERGNEVALLEVLENHHLIELVL